MFRSLIALVVASLVLTACLDSHQPVTRSELSFSEALAPYCAHITDPQVLRRSCNAFLVVDGGIDTLITGVDADGISPRVVFFDSSRRSFGADYFRDLATGYNPRTMHFVGPRDADYNATAGRFFIERLDNPML